MPNLLRASLPVPSAHHCQLPGAPQDQRPVHHSILYCADDHACELNDGDYCTADER